LKDWTYNGRLENAMKKIWPFSFYFLYYAAMASFLPFIVLFYQQLGFSGVQIGLLTGVPPLITLFAGPFWTSVADKSRRHNLILGVGIVSAALIILFISTLTNFMTIFIFVVLFNISFAPVASLGDSATMAMLGDQRAMYGRVRLGGTIGWGIFAQVAGILLYRYGLIALFYVFTGVMLINFFVSRNLSFGASEEHESIGSNVWTFLTNRRWIIFLLSAFLGGLGSISAASYLSPYLSELGANGNQIGFAFTIATVTELPVFFFGDILVKHFKPYGLFLISLVLIGLRSVLFGIVNTVFWALVIQGIGGMFFPAMWSGGVAYAYEHAPHGLKSTAQGVFGAASFGIGSAVGGLLCGVLLEQLGGRGMFMVLGIIILAGLALIEGAKQLFPDKELVQANI